MNNKLFVLALSFLVLIVSSCSSNEEVEKRVKEMTTELPEEEYVELVYLTFEDMSAKLDANLEEYNTAISNGDAFNEKMEVTDILSVISDGQHEITLSGLPPEKYSDLHYQMNNKLGETLDIIFEINDLYESGREIRARQRMDEVINAFDQAKMISQQITGKQ